MNKQGPFHKIRPLISALAVLSLLALFFLFGPSPSFAYDLEQKVVKHELENGLVVLILERRVNPTVSLYIRHKVGALQEDEGSTGAAHLLEHMLFKGTKTIGTKDYRREKRILDQIRRTGNALDLERLKGERADRGVIDGLSEKLRRLQTQAKGLMVDNEIDRLYTENGAVDLNASTGQDLTTYHVSLPANKLELWARIESDRMMNPVFREFYPERDVVMEERKQTVESTPKRKLTELFLATAFQAHPYRRPVIGWPSDVQSLSMDYIEWFSRTYHAPNNTVIAVVGDVDPVKALGIVKKYFGAIKPVSLPPLRITAEPTQQGEKRVALEADANPHLLIGYHKPTLPSFDDYVFDVIDALLTRGRTSRLYRTLVEERGIAESISTANGLPGAKYPNLFVVMAAPRHPHTAEELEAAIHGEIEKLKKEPVSPRELEKVVNQFRADLIRDLDSNAGLAGKLSYYEAVAGDFRYITRHIQVVESITPDDIMKVARNYLVPENRTVATLVKRGKP
ncbi:MAG TPA: pitrilysin family protein [Syntrophales bacterium]|nr:pitrilysin family protein [Syntrophales bacterium]HOX95138.1 pitrilysin family protein [Syntrophales bacterium]HPI55932.1 pitrilysin family protein [Syntrophales bacterium]HPN23577.1 pitrilysin family protein [Syntrophales bacterium]HQM27898.1 pitrilysin family protein [Syntrophales bacterium]